MIADNHGRRYRRVRYKAGPMQAMTLRLFDDELEAVAQTAKKNNLTKSAAAAYLLRRGAELQPLES